MVNDSSGARRSSIQVGPRTLAIVVVLVVLLTAGLTAFVLRRPSSSGARAVTQAQDPLPASPWEPAAESETSTPRSLPPVSATPPADTTRWQGRIRVGGIDLDAVPPQSVVSNNDIDAHRGPSFILRPGVRGTQWTESTEPTRDDCLELALTQSWPDNQSVVEEVPVGMAICVQTGGGHTAFLRVTETQLDAFFADVLVWEK